VPFVLVKVKTPLALVKVPNSASGVQVSAVRLQDEIAQSSAVFDADVASRVCGERHLPGRDQPSRRCPPGRGRRSTRQGSVIPSARLPGVGKEHHWRGQCRGRGSIVGLRDQERPETIDVADLAVVRQAFR